MHGVRALLGLLPLLTVVFTAYAVRPGAESHIKSTVFGPFRLAVIRAAVIVGAGGVVSVEVLSAFNAIRTVPVLILWIAAVATAGIVAFRRHQRDAAQTADRGQTADRLRAYWTNAPRSHRILIVGMAGLFLAELVLAFASPPNTWDSNYYHLPKIEHWVAQHSVELYATTQVPQIVLVPGAEYLLLHLRLLTGGDMLYNLLQWAAGIGGALAVSRITGQLGAGRLGQLLSAALFVTAPMVVLQATSTQTDLAAAAWLVCLASLVLDETQRRTRLAETALIGAATGLTAITKTTALMGVAAVLLIWGFAQLRLRWIDREHLWKSLWTVVSTLAICAVALALIGPMLLRLDRMYGSPLGPAWHSQNMSMQRHDVPAITVNALRMASSVLVVPAPPVNRAVADGVIKLSTWLGVDAQDRAITLGTARYPNPRWKPDEDHSPYPIQAALVLAAMVATLVVRRVPAGVRAYALAALLAMVLYATFVRWQTWGNRLMLPGLTLALPLAGWWLARLVPAPGVDPRGAEQSGAEQSGAEQSGAEQSGAEQSGAEQSGVGQGGVGQGGVGQGGVGQSGVDQSGVDQGRARRAPKIMAAATAVTVAFAFAGGYGSVLFGWPRRLVGQYSALTTPDYELRFARQSWRADSYRRAADLLRESGAQRIGLIVVTDTWEYPFWVLLPGREFVSLRSAEPGPPPVSITSVDAVACVTSPQDCRSVVPPGWRFESMDDLISVAYPIKPTTTS